MSTVEERLDTHESILGQFIVLDILNLEEVRLVK